MNCCFLDEVKDNKMKDNERILISKFSSAKSRSSSFMDKIAWTVSKLWQFSILKKDTS